MKKLFVGRLPWEVTDEELEQLFEVYGKVLSAKVIFDRVTNRSKGFGFVEMEDDASAQEAVAKLNGAEVKGRTIVVNPAKERE